MQRTLYMRSDFILPASLAVALVMMVGYAATGDGNKTSDPFASPISCQATSTLTSIADIREASGLASSRRTPQLLWAHNDSADPAIYGVGEDGVVRGRVRIAGASVVDWEAITSAECPGGDCLFIGDIGDNDRGRGSITVYRVVEPAPSDKTSSDAVAIEGVYPEGPQDAEAMFLLNGTLFIVTKGEGAPVRLYRFPALEAGSRQTLQLVATLSPAADKSGRVTDAAVSPDGRWVALRSNDVVHFYPAQALAAGTPGTPRAFDVRSLKEPQGEGLAWRDPQTLFLAGEGAEGGTFVRVSCPALH